MAAREPIAEKLPSSLDHEKPTTWAEAVRRLTDGGAYWLATVRPDGRPYVRSLLAVWHDAALCFVAGAATRKAKNLSRNSYCSISLATDVAHLVVEGSAKKISDEVELQRVAVVYDSKYEWQVVVREGAFYAEGAPTAGRPPYEVYKVKPKVVFGFGTDESFSPTRWRF